MRFLRWLATKIKALLKKTTSFISKATTATVLTGGALVGITRLNGQVNVTRLTIAGMAFVIGLPLGLIVFGPAFNLLIWGAIVVGTLFAMNLDNVWEVISALRYGGLEYTMAKQAVEAASSITPNNEDIKKLRAQITVLEKQLGFNAISSKSGGILGKKALSEA
ncbi:MAG: hypothetical protein WC441_05270 [Patescibacteria group bacterium]